MALPAKCRHIVEREILFVRRRMAHRARYHINMVAAAKMQYRRNRRPKSAEVAFSLVGAEYQHQLRHRGADLSDNLEAIKLLIA